MIETLRIGGGGVNSEKVTATTTRDRLALIDRQLDELSSRPRGGVIYLEIDRDRDGFATLDRYRTVVDGTAVATPELIEFMRVGVMGQLGAAEYAKLRLDGREQTVCATYNPNPAADQPNVLYDDCVPQHFPPTTVVALTNVRRLMIDFALTGEWSDVVPWKHHETLVV